MTKKIITRQLLQLICLAMVVTIGISACKKDKVTNDGKVVLLSFGATGIKLGDPIIFIGNNLDKVTGIELVGASIPASAFTTHTTEQIIFVVPQSTQEGFATLKTPDGDVISKTKVNFLVPVVVTSITASARPGDNISIKGQYMNWIKEVRFAKDVVETVFVSKSLTELIVKVPQSAQTGKLIVSTGGVKPLVIETDSLLKVTLPMITSFAPTPLVRGDNLTLTGTNLDLVKGVQFKGLSPLVTTFVSQTSTQLVLKAPATAAKGKITLVAWSGVTTESATSLLFVGDLPDLAPLGYAFYIDALQGSWQNWGWGSTTDFGNTENVRDGNASIKQTYTGQWSALKFANGSMSTAPYTEFAFSVFGAPGTGGKLINITPSGGSTYTITVTAGAWVDFKLTKAQLGNPTTITDITFQNQDWTGLIYVDHVGFR
ncbi:MAG: hypothetical protein ABIX01_03695 [Chitinophagaceae bacterium]